MSINVCLTFSRGNCEIIHHPMTKSWAHVKNYLNEMFNPNSETFIDGSLIIKVSIASITILSKYFHDSLSFALLFFSFFYLFSFDFFLFFYFLSGQGLTKEICAKNIPCELSSDNKDYQTGPVNIIQLILFF